MTQSKAQKTTQWIVHTCSNSRGLLGLAVVLGLSAISITFNWQLGKLSAAGSNDVSSQLMPLGYSMLDLAALFLCGFVGIKTQDTLRKCIAWVWFAFLLSLSLWAAMSFAISVDHTAQTTANPAKIAAQQGIVADAAANVDTWQKNLDGTTLHKSRFQKTLNQAKADHQAAVAALNALYDSEIPPALAIYYKVGPLVGVSPEAMATIMRLVWAAGLTLSPLVVMMLITAEFVSGAQAKTSTQPTETPAPPKGPAPDPKPGKKHPAPSNEEPERIANFPAQRGNTAPFPAPVAVPSAGKAASKVAEKVEGVKGHNQHTSVLDLNGLKKAKAWLDQQPVGRITRNKLQGASGVKGRENISRIIAELLNTGWLVRLGNGQLSKPEHRKPLLKSVGGSHA